MILDIEDYNGDKIGAIQFYNDNIINTKGDISFADKEDFDDIFCTNDYKIRIQLDNINNNNIIIDNIIDNIVSSRHGELYYDEIGIMFIDDYFSELKENIFNEVDKIMIEKYTKDDNMTIR